MKKERKMELLNCFPCITSEQLERMKGKNAANFVVFLTHGRELFARCYHRYSNGELIERNRYVFAKDGCVRYGSDYGTTWSIRSQFREPVFCSTAYGYSFDNSYSVINIKAIDKSDMKYSQYNKYKGKLLISYLGLYCRHPNLEYPVKQGFDVIDEYYSGYWGGIVNLKLSDRINWCSNNLLQMLNLNRTELKLLKGREHIYYDYVSYRESFPRLKPEDVANIAQVFGGERGTLDQCISITGLTPQRLSRYLAENDIYIRDYLDYAKQCRQLDYNMRDTAISMPRDFWAMHNRASEIIKYNHDNKVKQQFVENLNCRKKLEYASGGLIIRQPQSIEEIVDEGAKLSHCVGGYAERHATGKLHIMFLRKKIDPNTPFYTVEVSTSGKIVQCRGFKNNWETKGGKPKAQEIIDFEKEYQQYLDKIFATENKKKERKSA